MATSQKDWKQPNSRTECLKLMRLILYLSVVISLFLKRYKKNEEKWFVHPYLSAGTSRP